MTPFIDPQNLLTQQELEILQEADACPYEISYAKSLGDIHQQVPVYILTRKEESRQRKVVVTEAELKELQEQAKREQDELLRKMEDGTLTAEEQKNLDKNLHYYRQVLSARAGEPGQPDDRLRYESAASNAGNDGELYGQRDGDVLSERALDEQQPDDSGTL